MVGKIEFNLFEIPWPFRIFARTILEISTGLRNTLRRDSHLELEDRIYFLQQFEALRAISDDIDRRKSPSLEYSNRIRKIIGDITSHRDFKDVESRRYFPALPRSATKAEVEKDATVGHVVNIILSSLDSFEIELKLGSDQGLSNPLRQLRRVVPEQKVAPIQFEFIDDVLKVRHSSARFLQEDEHNVHAARSALIQQGRAIIEGLKSSNCDQRFTANVEHLQEKLESAEDVVQLAIFNLACEELRQKFESELPDVLAVKLKSHLSSVGMYVAQFPDWARFTENAGSVELSESDIRKTKEVADELVVKLTGMPSQVDPEVPQTIKAISDVISDPSLTSKRASFALLRSLENLYSKIMSYAANFADELVSETSKKFAKWGSSAIAGVLVAAIVNGAGVLAPVYSKFADSAWMKSAVEIIQKIKPPE